MMTIDQRVLDRLQDPLALAGRILIAALFIPEGWDQAMDLSGTASYIASQGVPLPQVCAMLSVFAHVGLSLLIVVGWQARWAALGLAIFVAVITPLFHNYWTMEGARRGVNELMFWKNGAILGGLLIAAAFGPGRWSLDGRPR
jgi:putative oxidoreductase